MDTIVSIDPSDLFPTSEDKKEDDKLKEDTKEALRVSRTEKETEIKEKRDSGEKEEEKESKKTEDTEKKSGIH